MSCVSSKSILFTGQLSPCSSVCGSTVSQSIAPTLPSAPLSPTDSELCDDSQFNFFTDGDKKQSPARSRLLSSSVISSPIQEGIQTNFADDVKNLARAYSWLDDQNGGTILRKKRGDNVTSMAGGGGGVGGGASGNLIGSATWSPQSATAQLPGSVDAKPALAKTTSSYSYTQLRYPP